MVTPMLADKNSTIMRRDARLLFASVTLLIAAPFLVVLIMWQIGLFEFGPNASDAKVVAATLGLVGVLFTSTVSVFGLMFKHSIDQRSLTLREESEARLRKETALQAIELMTSTSDKIGLGKERKEGALIALANLGELNLSIILLENLWANDQIGTSTAVNLLDEAFMTGTPIDQQRASTILEKYHAKLVESESSFHFPNCVYLKWNAELDYPTKYEVFTALVNCMLSKPKSYWKNHVKNQFLYTMHRIVELEPDERLKYSAALCSKELSSLLNNEIEDGGFIPPDRETIGYGEINAIAEHCLQRCYERGTTTTEQHFQLSESISKWEGSS